MFFKANGKKAKGERGGVLIYETKADIQPRIREIKL